MKVKSLAATAVVCLLCVGAAAREYVHPGLLHTSEAIDRMRGYIAEEAPPAYDSFLMLSEATRADYCMAGPWETIARDGEHRTSKDGCERDCLAAYQCALMWCLTGDERYCATAMKIVRAYSYTLHGIAGHDAPLMAGLNGFILINACELLRYTCPLWTSNDTRQTESMFCNVFLPVLDAFEAASPYANGNWGVIVNKMRLATGVYCNDSTLVAAALDYYLNAYDNGALPHYVAPTGQCQESGRDQAHAMLGLAALAETCEVAWSQGRDLYGALDNRLLAGCEYTARANLGFDVPFDTWQDVTGLYSSWDELGVKALGKWRPWLELPYNHYVGRCGLKMPFCSAALSQHLRPEGASVGCDNVGYGSLLFYLGTEVKPMGGRRKSLPEYKPVLLTYPAAEGASLRHDYRVEVRADGGEWTELPTYEAQANVAVGDRKHKVSGYSYAYCDFTGSLAVRVTKLCGKTYRQVEVRPRYHGIVANAVNDSTVSFALMQPENVSVEFDGDVAHNLLLFTRKPPLSREQAQREAKKSGRKFIYIPAGYHKADAIEVPSHTTVYLEGGAYVDGWLQMRDVSDITICGRGVVRPSEPHLGVELTRCRNVVVDGIITTQCPVGESEDVTIRDVCSLTHYPWGDGLNVFASRSVLFDRVFCRNSDDCTTVYASRFMHCGSSTDVTMQNSTLWADVAHPIFIGLHGNSELMDSCTNLAYRNIDILCQSEPQMDYQGCMAINAGDNNLVSDVVFDNIRVENIAKGSLLQLRVCENEKYCTAPGRGIHNVTFRRIRYEGTEPEPSIIVGYNEERMVQNVHFYDLRINGHRIWDNMPDKPSYYKTADMARFFVGEHVQGVTFER